MMKIYLQNEEFNAVIECSDTIGRIYKEAFLVDFLKKRVGEAVTDLQYPEMMPVILELHDSSLDHKVRMPKTLVEMATEED